MSGDNDWDRSRAGWRIVGSRDAVLLIEDGVGHREAIALWPMLPEAARQAIERYRAGEYDGEDVLALVNFAEGFLI